MKVVLAVVIASFVVLATSEDLQIEWFDCTSSSDGKYENPMDCLRFIDCSGGEAYDRGCDVCPADPIRCPHGYMIYNSTGKMCMWADETRCAVGTLTKMVGTTTKTVETTEITKATTAVASPPTTKDANPNRLPQAEESCNPEESRNLGYCQSYLKCDKKTGTWVKEKCGENLIWNPWNPTGMNQIHEGKCDLWDNLSPQMKRQYRLDPVCLACYRKIRVGLWWPLIIELISRWILIGL